jgi:hypothetical protein
MKTTLALLISISPILWSCSNCVHGDGKPVTENRALSGFTGISVNCEAEVTLGRDTIEGIRIESESNIIPEITTTISNGKLSIGTRKCISPKNPVKIFCSLRELRSLELNGSGKITSTNVFPSGSGILEVLLDGSGKIETGSNAQKITTTLNGDGEITLKGGTGEHNIRLNGSGDIHAFELSSNVSNVNIAGSGDAEVSVNKDLEASISGSGDILYKGTPEKLNMSTNGSGKVKKKD